MPSLKFSELGNVSRFPCIYPFSRGGYRFGVLLRLRWNSVDRFFIFCYAAVWQRWLVCLGVLLMPRMSSVDRLRILIFAAVWRLWMGFVCCHYTTAEALSSRSRQGRLRRKGARWASGRTPSGRGRSRSPRGGPQAEGGVPFTALVSRRRMSVRAGGGVSYRKKAGFSLLSLGWHSVPRVYRRRDRVTGLVRPIGWGGCYDGFPWIRGFLEKG